MNTVIKRVKDLAKLDPRIESVEMECWDSQEPELTVYLKSDYMFRSEEVGFVHETDPEDVLWSIEHDIVHR